MAADGNHLSSPRMAALLAPLGLTENPWIYNPSFTIVAWLLCLMDYRGLIARCIKQAHHVNNTRPRNKPTSSLTCLCGLRTVAASRLLTAILSLQNSSKGVNVNLRFYIIVSVLCWCLIAAGHAFIPHCSVGSLSVMSGLQTPPCCVPEMPGQAGATVSAPPNKTIWSARHLETTYSISSSSNTPDNWHYITVPDSGRTPPTQTHMVWAALSFKNHSQWHFITTLMLENLCVGLYVLCEIPWQVE